MNDLLPKWRPSWKPFWSTWLCNYQIFFYYRYCDSDAKCYNPHQLKNKKKISYDNDLIMPFQCTGGQLERYLGNLLRKHSECRFVETSRIFSPMPNTVQILYKTKPMKNKLLWKYRWPSWTPFSKWLISECPTFLDIWCVDSGVIFIQIHNKSKSMMKNEWNVAIVSNSGHIGRHFETDGLLQGQFSYTYTMCQGRRNGFSFGGAKTKRALFT